MGSACCRVEKRQETLKGTSKNALFPRWLRQLRARILMYDVYTAVLRAVLPCPHEKITIFRGALNSYAALRQRHFDMHCSRLKAMNYFAENR